MEIVGRIFIIKDYGDEYTRSQLARMVGQETLAVIKPDCYHHIHEIFEIIESSYLWDMVPW